MSVLVDWQIEKAIKKGELIISPFKPQHLNTVSYDVTLGAYFIRANSNDDRSFALFNPRSTVSIKNRWKSPQKATQASKVLSSQEIKAEEIEPKSLVIILNPGELILGHTVEFIGGIKNVTTAMHARSTTGRGGISVCMCAGWGDVGYFNRWTMEIRNNSDEFRVVLPVGARIAQISFEGVENPRGIYTKGGHYQVNKHLSELKKNWKPEHMLPKPL